MLRARPQLRFVVATHRHPALYPRNCTRRHRRSPYVSPFGIERARGGICPIWPPGSILDTSIRHLLIPITNFSRGFFCWPPHPSTRTHLRKPHPVPGAGSHQHFLPAAPVFFKTNALPLSIPQKQMGACVCLLHPHCFPSVREHGCGSLPSRHSDSCLCMPRCLGRPADGAPRSPFARPPLLAR